jgi:hypothetical protein
MTITPEKLRELMIRVGYTVHPIYDTDRLNALAQAIERHVLDSLEGEPYALSITAPDGHEIILKGANRKFWESINHKCQPLSLHPSPKVEGEPVILPCCGYTKDAIKWNPFNGVVQCHNCGQTYYPSPSLAEDNATIEALRKDAKRLDFIISKQAFMVSGQLFIQNEDEEYVCLHSKSMFYATAREAIDAAMKGEKR